MWLIHCTELDIPALARLLEELGETLQPSIPSTEEMANLDLSPRPHFIYSDDIPNDNRPILNLVSDGRRVLSTRLQNLKPERRDAALESSDWSERMVCLHQSSGCVSLAVETLIVSESPERVWRRAQRELGLPVSDIKLDRSVLAQVCGYSEVRSLDPELAPKFWDCHRKGMEVYFDVTSDRSHSQHPANLCSELERSRRQLERQAGQLQNLNNQLWEKEQVIQGLLGRTGVIKWVRHRFLGFPIVDRALLRLKKRTAAWWCPPMLRQYEPRSLLVPKRYFETKPLPKPLKISIVTPSYQQGPFLEETILSVLDQHYPQLEYSVQDGGSTDNSLEVIDKYRSRLKKAASQPDKGQAQAINRGFEGSTGEVMAWLNSDDLLLPGTLHFVANYFQEHPEVDVLYGHRVLVDERGMEIGRWMMPSHDPEVLKWADMIPQETLFWRRSLWERVGCLDESFQFALDWDLLLRFQEAGAKFSRVKRFLAAFRVHPDQKTSRELGGLGVQEMNRLRLRTLGYCPEDEQVAQQLKSYMFRAKALFFLHQTGILRH